MPLEKHSVLVVEDDEVDVRTIQRAFARKGLADSLAFSRDGQAALERLQAPGCIVPRLVLLDQNMPRMTGLEFLQRIREDPRLREVPVVMISTSRIAAERSRAQSLGVLGYLVKEEMKSDYGALFELIDPLV